MRTDPRVPQSCVNMASGRRRENTFKIDLNNFPKRPSYEAIHEFIYNELKIAVEKVIMIQPHTTNNCYYIKTSDLQTAQQTVTRHDNEHFIEVEGKRIKVHLEMEDGTVEVKLAELSECITNEQIVKHMRAYGNVLDIRGVVWSNKFIYKGVNTGAKIVKMVLRQPIKSYINIEDEVAYVTYSGQIPTCKYCHSAIHTGFGCAANRKLQIEKGDINDRLRRNRSYAEILQGNDTETSSRYTSFSGSGPSAAPKIGIRLEHDTESTPVSDVECESVSVPPVCEPVNGSENNTSNMNNENNEEQAENVFKIPNNTSDMLTMDISDDENTTSGNTTNERQRKTNTDEYQTDSSTVETSTEIVAKGKPSRKKTRIDTRSSKRHDPTNTQ